MIIKTNEILAPYTTFKIGGKTPKMFIPESKEELIGLIEEFRKQNKEYYLLGNGSNILINDQGIGREIINNRQSCKFINFKEGGIVEVGSSFKLGEFIRLCVNNNLKVFTKLITIPGTIGGAVYMNAGRSKVSISDYLLSVEVFNGKEIKSLKKEDCHFSHRYSVFHEYKNWIVLSTKYKFDYQSKEEGIKKMSEEINFKKDLSYFKYPSAGSVFKDKHDFIMRILKGFKIGDAQYSKSDDNSILNLGKAKFKDVVKLINLAKFLHFITFQKCALEIEIWQ